MRRWKRPTWVCGGVFLVYALLTLVMTWPVVARLNTHLVGNGDDMWVHYWNGWWVKRVLQQGGDVYFTPLLFHPTGVSLLYHNFAWVNIALWLALEPILGGIRAYNLVHLLHIPLCGLGMFLLARRLTKSEAAAFVSGLIFAFWPYRMLDANHPNMISTEVFPLFMLALLRLFQDRKPLRDGLTAGLLLALIGYMRWQLVILAAFMAAVYLLYTLIWERERWRWQTVAGLALMGAVALALMAPALYPLARELVGGVPKELYKVSVKDYKQDLWYWILPQHQHPLRGLYDSLFARYIDTTLPRDYSAFSGYVAIGLAVVGAVRRRRQREVVFWLGLGILCLVLSLGPYLQFNGVAYTNIPLPFQSVGWLQPIRMLRYPHRFIALLAVPVAVLAGYGTLALREWLAQRRWGNRLARPAVLVILLGVLVLLDYLSVPTATVPADVPDFYSALAEEPGDFAVVDLPGMRHYTEYYMFYQTVHGRPLLGGHVSRLPGQALKFMSSIPLLKDAYKSESLNTQVPDVSRQLSLLAEAGFRYLVLHKNLAPPEQLDEWRTYLVMSPRYEDEEVVAYSTAPVAGMDYPLNYDLGAGMGLVDASLSTETVSPDAILEFQFIWGTRASPGIDFQVEVALVDGEGNVGQARRFEISPAWPTGEWPANAIVRDKYAFQIEPRLGGGTYTVVASLVSEGNARPVGRRVALGEVVMLALERRFTAPPMDHRLEATFGDVLRLLGYDLAVEADAAHITLHWQSLRRMDEAYKMFVHVFDPQSGELVAQADVMPRDWGYPTNWWEASEVVSDEISLSLTDVPVGAYGLKIGVYDPVSLERLPAQTVDGQLLLDGQVVPAETIHIPAAED